MKYINTRKIRQKFFVIYESSYEDTGFKSLTFYKMKIKDKVPFIVRNKVKPSSFNTIIPNYYENNKDQHKIYFDNNGKLLNLDDNLELFIELTNDYFNSSSNLARFYFLYKQKKFLKK